jgi:rare lipoprotein A
MINKVFKMGRHMGRPLQIAVEYPRVLPCLFALFLALLTACAHAPSELPPPPPEGTAYRAVTTWYGPGFQGKRTASGEVFDMNGFTAAHKTFPFGTKLRVTNPKNGKSVVVVVNDRGPFVEGRELDLSRAAAFAIGAYKMCEVDIEVLGREMRYAKDVKVGKMKGSGSYWVQVGAFSDRDNAEHMRLSLGLERTDVKVIEVVSGGKKFHRVRVGAFAGRSAAYTAARGLADEGYDTWIVRE